MKSKKSIIKIIIFAVFILVIVLGIKLYNKDNNIADNSNENTQIKELPNDTNPGGIDVEKLDNAKVVEGEKENTSNLLLENREFEGLEFSNIKLKSINGVSNFTAIVKNNTENVIDTKYLSLKFVDKDGNLISKLKIYIPTIGSESTTTVDASITADIINAYNFTIENIE